VRTRRLHPADEPDRPVDVSFGENLGGDDLGGDDLDVSFGDDLGGEDLVDDDLFGDPLMGTEAVVEEGFPAFEHNQWTVEGEIERFGAFGRGVSSARGWKRGVALGLLLLLLLPLLLEAAQIVARLVS
jgi:hypothetical protein